jgi:hypothetical protein
MAAVRRGNKLYMDYTFLYREVGLLMYKDDISDAKRLAGVHKDGRLCKEGACKRLEDRKMDREAVIGARGRHLVTLCEGTVDSATRLPSLQ